MKAPAAPPAPTTLHISLVGRGDLAGEIYRQTKVAILSGLLKPGQRLPATRELARSLAVSRSTVTAAYERLMAEGLAEAQAGAATLVSRSMNAGQHRSPRRKAMSALQPQPIWESVRMLVAFDAAAKFDFRIGLPDATLFPHLAWRRAITRALRSSEAAEPFYEPTAGLPSLRRAIVEHIAISRGVRASAENVVITNGTQQALDILARALLAPGDVIAMEDPGYTPALHLFRSLRLQVVGVPVDSEGLVVDQLPANVRAVYVTPSHQFPLGVAMSLRRRRALLDWAARHGAAIIEDDYDSEFRFGGRPLEPVQTLDAAGRVIYIGSFSKTMLPALRLGFLVFQPALQSAILKAKFVSDWHSASLAQKALARFIHDGSFARHVRRAGQAYAQRHAFITGALERDFSDHVELVPSHTGLHLAVLARNASARKLASVVRRAADAGVAVQPLANFAIGSSIRAGITIGYGAIPISRIAEGLRRLRRCFEAER